MRMFTNDAIKNAEEDTLYVYRKLASLKPAKEFDSDDISKTMFYIRDYMDELRVMKKQRGI